MPEILSDDGHSWLPFRQPERSQPASPLPFGYVELHGLPFLQAAKTASLDRREMHEDILPTLAADKAVAFGIVKPLYCSLFHCLLFRSTSNYI
jgi:hypothetical protein